MAEGVFHLVANLLNLEVGLLLFDTTSTYFEVDGEDEPVHRGKNGNAADPQETAAEVKPAPIRPTASPRTTATTRPGS